MAQNSNFVPITTKITAQDAGGSNLNNLQYQISSSSTIPADNDANWKDFTSGASITENKSGGTWYLYTKVTDHAGNRATSIQKSNPYVVNYSVKYDANGGTGTPENQIKEFNKTLTLSNVTPTRTGYTFAGWSTNQNSSTAEYQAGGTYTNNASVTLYAVWKAKQVEVTFVRNTSSTDNTSVKQTFTYGVTGQKFSDKDWTKAGYSLLGWNKDRNATTQQYSTLSGVSDAWINSNSPKVTLYAIWEDNIIPTMGSLTVNTTAWTNGNVTLTGKARDLGSGISYYQFSTNASLTSSSSGWTSITNTTAEITKTHTVTTNGNYYFYVKDASGNINKKSIVVKNIDKTVPSTATVSAGSVNNKTVTITAKGADGQSGVASYQFYVGGALKSTQTTTSGSATYTYTTTFGSVNAYIVVTDAVGNTKKSNTITIWDYTIKTNDELRSFSSYVNSGTNFSGKTITLLNNLSYNSSLTPIGSPSKPFSGTFEGGNHSITGLSINASDYTGLFGYSSGPIKNLTLSSPGIKGSNYVGGIAGKSTSTITNCHINNPTIKSNTSGASSNVGGIAGESTGTISNCDISSGSVAFTNSWDGWIGGIAGTGNNISSCHNRGTAILGANTSGPNAAGGIVGSHEKGLLEKCSNTGSVSGYGHIGGIAGKTIGTLRNSFNSATDIRTLFLKRRS